MTLTLNSLLAMAWRTVRNPREGAEEILALGVPREALWTALALVVVISIFLAQLTELIMVGAGATPMPIGPAATGFIQFALLVAMVFAIHLIGRAMGGGGSLEEAILLVSWLQFVLVCVQVVQTVLVLILPQLAVLVGIAGLALFFWLLTNFIAVLHGFRSLFKVFLMIVVTMIGISVGLAVLLALIGVTMPMVSPA